MNRNIFIIVTLISAACLWSCRPYTPTPRKKGYFKLEMPTEHTYQKFSMAGFPFEFEYPHYAKITQDTNLVLQEKAPYWINVSFLDYNATIYLSYKPITAADPLEKLIDDSYRLSYGHDKRADYIESEQIRTPHNLYGVKYQIGGNAASAHQFYLTDSVRHFLRGSLYFETVPNADSLAPAIRFLNEDMQHLVETLKFR